ncbi:MAG: hypothetical protein PHP60_07920, partial [Bacteroidales bacterium]|nr:hypothetical protein [Bacteroidales bacterium]
MKNFFTLIVLVFSILSVSSCVQKSQKYKDLQAKLDSLTVVKDSVTNRMEEVFTTLNEVENGLRNIREAENI